MAEGLGFRVLGGALLAVALVAWDAVALSFATS